VLHELGVTKAGNDENNKLQLSKCINGSYWTHFTMPGNKTNHDT